MARNIIEVPSTITQLQPKAQYELVRIGSENDGGYVVSSSAVSNAQYLFSGGYGNDFSFEKDFLRISSADSVIMFDYSITIVSLLRGLASFFKSLLLRRSHYSLSHHLRNILNYFLLLATPRISLIHKKLTSGTQTSEVTFSNLENALLAVNYKNDEKFFCKIDIEGCEYELIDEIVKLEKLISGMVIEFHDTYFKRDVFLRSLEKLEEFYAIVHTHVNNFGGMASDGQPLVYEISFINRRLEVSKLNLEKSDESLIEIDQPNNPNENEVNLLFAQ